MDTAGEVPDTQLEDQEEDGEVDGREDVAEQRKVSRRTATPRDTACRLCGEKFTKTGVKKHEKSCATKRAKEMQV